MKINLIIDRLYIYFQVDTNYKLAEKLGISPTAISNWKKRNTIDYDLIFTKCDDVDFNWLIKGDGEPFKNKFKHEPKPYDTVEEPGIIDNCKLCKEKDKRIDALERIIRTQEELIDTLKHEDCSSNNEQKRKVG